MAKVFPAFLIDLHFLPTARLSLRTLSPLVPVRLAPSSDSFRFPIWPNRAAGPGPLGTIASAFARDPLLVMARFSCLNLAITLSHGR